MRLEGRDLLSTYLVLLIAVPYVGYLVRGDVPFVEDARGMAAVGLLLGAAAYLVLRHGDPVDRTGKIEDFVALSAVVLGVMAFALAETAAAEVLLAGFMGSILVVWAVKLLDHAGMLPTAHRPTGSA
jgi:riboflavin transporter FmnP